METVCLKTLLEGIYDGPHATPKKTSSGPIFLGISSLVNGRIDVSKSAHLSEESFVKWTKRITPRPNDLVFSYETRIGECAIIPEGLLCCLGRRMGLLRPDTRKVDPRYLLYVWLGREFQDTLRARTIHGSTVDRILLTELPDFPITIVSDVEEQKRITAVLGAVDEKIRANDNESRTLAELRDTLLPKLMSGELRVQETETMVEGMV